MLLIFLPQGGQGAIRTSVIGNSNSWAKLQTEKCPSGAEAAVGIRVEGAQYVDEVGLYCAPTNDLRARSARYGGAVNGVNTLDSGFGRVERSAYCPDGYVITGLRGKGGLYVDKIVSIRCTRWKSSTHRWKTVNAGGGGGSTQDALCPAGTYIDSIGGKAGLWVDALWALCRGW